MLDLDLRNPNLALTNTVLAIIMQPGLAHLCILTEHIRYTDDNHQGIVDFFQRPSAA